MTLREVTRTVIGENRRARDSWSKEAFGARSSNDANQLRQLEIHCLGRKRRVRESWVAERSWSLAENASGCAFAVASSEFHARREIKASDGKTTVSRLPN